MDENSAVSAPRAYDDQVVVVTGAGRGLGRAYAHEFARHGAKVVVNDLGNRSDGTGPPDRLIASAVVEEIRAAGGDAVADGNDVATESGAAALIETAVQHYGTVHAVVHNAGVVRRADFADMAGPTLNDVLGVGLMGAFHVARAAWPLMTRQVYGRIVLTGSGAGLFGAARSANYAAARMGIVGLALSLAGEGRAHGIQANVIVPIAQTRLATTLPAHVIDRLTPEQVAPVVAWLAHRECAATGEIYSAAGGRVNRVVLGVTPGLDFADISLEAVRDRFAEISSLDDVRTVPTSPDALKLRLPAATEAPE